MRHQLLATQSKEATCTTTVCVHILSFCLHTFCPRSVCSVVPLVYYIMVQSSFPIIVIAHLKTTVLSMVYLSVCLCYTLVHLLPFSLLPSQFHHHIFCFLFLSFYLLYILYMCIVRNLKIAVLMREPTMLCNCCSFSVNFHWF